MIIHHSHLSLPSSHPTGHHFCGALLDGSCVLQGGHIKLVYNHLPKTGGTFVKYALAKVIPPELLGIRTEFQGFTGMEVGRDFVVGSIRHPCNYYLSLWGFGSDGKGDLYSRQTANMKKILYGHTPPYNNTEDLEALDRWLGRNAGVLSNRLKQSYALPGRPFDASLVDCWLETEHLLASLERCLNLYESRGGVVKWHELPSPEDGHTNPSSHASCTEMFDETRQSIVEKRDIQIMKQFNYTSCCSPSQSSIHGDHATS